MINQKDFQSKQILYIALFLSLLSIFYQNLFATSYAHPQKQTIHSANKEYFVIIDPNTKIHNVYHSKNPKTVLWRFVDGVGHETYALSNSGDIVVRILWKFVSIKNIENGCIIIYKKGVNEVKKKDSKTKLSNVFDPYIIYPYKDVTILRKYKKDEVGPIGDFWRIWYESIKIKKNRIIILLSLIHI